jgi:hypothetical protein
MLIIFSIYCMGFSFFSFKAAQDLLTMLHISKKYPNYKFGKGTLRHILLKPIIWPYLLLKINPLEIMSIQFNKLRK